MEEDAPNLENYKYLWRKGARSEVDLFSLIICQTFAKNIKKRPPLP
jgi:hypothetical protein